MSIQGPAVLPCSEQIAIINFRPSLWHLTASLSSSPGAAKLEPVGPALLISAVKKVEQCYIIDRLLSIFATVVSICFDHDSVQSRVTPRSVVTSTCSISTWCITRFNCLYFHDITYGKWTENPSGTQGLEVCFSCKCFRQNIWKGQLNVDMIFTDHEMHEVTCCT